MLSFIKIQEIAKIIKRTKNEEVLKVLNLKSSNSEPTFSFFATITSSHEKFETVQRRLIDARLLKEDYLKTPLIDQTINLCETCNSGKQQL